ncbi:hypothetical protein PACTADRAFT_16407, partial [Pachysolen tannophilus NRRL Y-2460]
MGRKYLLYLAQAYPNFRKAELESIAEMYGIKVDLSEHDETNPFLIVELENDDAARLLVKRSILARGIYELWGKGDDLGELHLDVQRRIEESDGEYIKRFIEDNSQVSFKFDFIGYLGGRKTQEERVRIIETFKYLDFKGPIRMKNPDEIFVILEEYHVLDENTAAEIPDRMWFGRQVQLSARIEENILDKYDLSKRPYIGTTSFDAELSLVTCNIGQVDKGKIMYDPFAGTGSFLVTGSYFGALTFGSDIDVRMLRGKGKQQTIESNFQKYKTSMLFGDVLTMDFTNNAFRPSFKIDSIVCDPPYGVREGLKVCGSKNPIRSAGKENVVINGEKAFLRRDYIQPKKSYELDSLLDDLLRFAAKSLPVGGRLSFWMPTANDRFESTQIPQHENLELIYNLVQEFNKWARRLLVYVKRDEDYKGKTMTKDDRSVVNNFRQRYFTGFREVE